MKPPLWIACSPPENPWSSPCFGSPYLAERFPAAKTWIAAFSTVDVAQRAMGRALFGQVAVGGRLPVNIPGVAALGAGLDLAANPMELREADATCGSKIAARV